MKKLLLIFLCLPMIGFGQKKLFNLDKKFKIVDIEDREFLEYNYAGATLDGKIFTGGVRKIMEIGGTFNSCLTYTEEHRDYMRALGTENFSQRLYNYYIQEWELKRPHYVSGDLCEEVEYFLNGKKLYTVVYFDNGTKTVEDYYHAGRDNRGKKTKSFSVYNSNNTISYYQSYYETRAGLDFIKRYFDNGQLFELINKKINYDGWNEGCKYISNYTLYDKNGDILESLEIDNCKIISRKHNNSENSENNLESSSKDKNISSSNDYKQENTFKDNLDIFSKLHTTSDKGYSGCIDEMTLKKLLNYTDKFDNQAFMRMHESGGCLVVPPGLKVNVLSKSEYGSRTLVELKTEGISSTIWTVIETIQN